MPVTWNIGRYVEQNVIVEEDKLLNVRLHDAKEAFERYLKYSYYYNIVACNLFKAAVLQFSKEFL